MAGKINKLIYIIYDILSNLENGHAIAWLFNMCSRQLSKET